MLVKKNPQKGKQGTFPFIPHLDIKLRGTRKFQEAKLFKTLSLPPVSPDNMKSEDLLISS